jgi:hypothetical protein
MHPWGQKPNACDRLATICHVFCRMSRRRSAGKW